jgi:hypothetical protein
LAIEKPFSVVFITDYQNNANVISESADCWFRESMMSTMGASDSQNSSFPCGGIMKYMALTLVIATSPVWAAGLESPASIPKVVYRSVFDDYKPMSGEALRDWRQANDDMGRLRGHMGHLDTEILTPSESHQHSKGDAKTPPGGRR